MNFFFHFLRRKRIIHRLCGNKPNGQTVQPTQLILISIEAEFCALQNYSVFFFHFSFRVTHLFQKKNHFCQKTENSHGVIFFRIQNLKKKLPVTL